MKKIITLVSSMVILLTLSAKAEIGIGISGAVHSFSASGTETLRESAKTTKADHDEVVAVPELFIEAISDNGFAFGFAYIPTRDLGSKARTDVADATGREAGTYKAKAELEDVMQIYTDIPSIEIAGFQTHFKLGIQHVTLASLESLNSGSKYPNETLLGYTIGYGVKGDLPYGNNLYYKGDLTYTNFETYEADGAGNKVSADLEDYAAKLSIGYKF
mgnify:CR=1 FL=1